MFKRLFSARRASPLIPEGRRVYAIGDIHGRLDLLDRLLAAIERDHLDRSPADAEVILLGDLIDRGPDSRGVVQRAMEGLSWATLTALMGNHEAVLLDVLDGDRERLALWLAVGGRETMQSWGVNPDVLEEDRMDAIVERLRAAMTPEETRFLKRMRRNVRIGDYFFVHAGVKPGVPLDRQRDEDCYWIRDEFLGSNRDHGAVIVHGHSIATELQSLANRIGLDTGAYATGRLTAIGLEGEERWPIQT